LLALYSDSFPAPLSVRYVSVYCTVAYDASYVGARTSGLSFVISIVEKQKRDDARAFHMRRDMDIHADGPYLNDPELRARRRPDAGHACDAMEGTRRC
jgi:hypothetical protein